MKTLFLCFFLFLEYYLRLSGDLTFSLCRRVFCSFQKQYCTYINKPIANVVIRRCSVKEVFGQSPKDCNEFLKTTK